MSHSLPSASTHASTSYHVSESVKEYGMSSTRPFGIRSNALDKGNRHGSDNSDPEDPPGPPKKKRRRQALSCTGTLHLLL